MAFLARKENIYSNNRNSGIKQIRIVAKNVVAKAFLILPLLDRKT